MNIKHWQAQHLTVLTNKNMKFNSSKRYWNVLLKITGNKKMHHLSKNYKFLYLYSNAYVKRVMHWKHFDVTNRPIIWPIYLNWKILGFFLFKFNNFIRKLSQSLFHHKQKYDPKFKKKKNKQTNKKKYRSWDIISKS